MRVVDFTAPDDLTELDQWVLWCFETRNGRQAKVPYQVTGRRADITNQRAWTTFEEALGTLCRSEQRYAGIGFAFSRDDSLAGIDLDNALDEAGVLKEWACGVVRRFNDTYMEISPGCRGLKIFTRGAIPANLPGVKVGDGQIEMYDHDRYFAVTGRAFGGAPLEVEDHSTDLLALYDRLTANRKGWSRQPMPTGRIPQGQQHNTLVSFCGTLRARGMCEEAIEACLQIVNERQCENPGPRENVTRIVRSSRRWGRPDGDKAV